MEKDLFDTRVKTEGVDLSKHKLRVTSDGSYEGTAVYLDDQRLDNVLAIEWKIGQDDLFHEVKLTFYLDDVEITHEPPADPEEGEVVPEKQGEETCDDQEVLVDVQLTESDCYRGTVTLSASQVPLNEAARVTNTFRSVLKA